MTAVVPGYLADRVPDLVSLQARVAHDRWLLSTGQKDHLDDATDHRCGWLTDGTLIADALNHGDLSYAHELILWYFRVSLAGATVRLRAVQRGTTAEVDGAALTHGQLVARSRTVGTEEGRAQVAAALATVNVRLRAARREWLDAYADARVRLGFATHGELVRALHPEVDATVHDARRWLAETRAGYLARARQWRHRDKVDTPSLGDARLVAARAIIPDAAATPLESTRTTVRAWGFGRHLDHILVDDVSRPGKVGFAFCSPVAPPTDVRVSVVAGRALQHHATAVHEFGHALHFTVGVTHPAQLWRTSPAMSEAFGFTLEGVVAEPEWQRDHLGVVLDPEAVERVRFARDHVRRLVAASLCFEIAVHDGCADPAAEYVRIHGEEFEVPVDGAAAWDRLQTYLEGQPCYPLVYYQAFALREPMWQHLVRHAGERWYADSSAGPALHSLFALLGETRPGEWLTLR
jgi:hypothetical protein